MTALHTRLFGLLSCVWGGILVYFYHSSRVHKYLAPDFHHFILIGGVGILVLGIYSVINPREKKACCDHNHHDHGHDHHDHHDHHDCEHDHGQDDHECGHHHHHEHTHDHDDCDTCDHDHEEGHGPVVTILLTLIPLLIAMSFTKDSLSNAGLSKKGLYEMPSLTNEADRPPFTREDLEKTVSRNKFGEFELRMITAYYAAGDREIQDIFDGLPVELEGRVAPEKLNNAKGDRQRIFRSIITCCAADLQVIGVSMEYPEGATRPAPNDWVKAGGILTFETIDGTVYPLLKIREVVQAEEPYSEFRLRQ